jgi:hypothetical protein
VKRPKHTILTRDDSEIFYRRLTYLQAVNARTSDRIDFEIMLAHTRVQHRLGASPAFRVARRSQVRPALQIENPKILNFRRAT